MVTVVRNVHQPPSQGIPQPLFTVVIWWFLGIGNPQKIVRLLLDSHWMILGYSYFDKPPFVLVITPTQGVIR